MTIKARVRASRLVVDEPTDLPEGTELELLPLEPGDWLDEADRAALHEALRESDADVAAGDSSTPKSSSRRSVRVDAAPGPIHGHGTEARST
jgi:hypothetical protein